MKTYFFDSDQSVLRLRHFAAEWEGTPFRAHSKVKQAGVDCVHLCAEIYKDVGVFPSYDFPAYTIDGGNHSELDKVKAWVSNSGYFMGPCTIAIPGDLVCFKFSKQGWHVGIMVANTKFIHSCFRSGVIVSDIGDPAYIHKICAVYRPTKL